MLIVWITRFSPQVKLTNHQADFSLFFVLDKKSYTALIINLFIPFFIIFTETNEVSISIFDKTNESVGMNF
jgi:hypothetical protein